MSHFPPMSKATSEQFAQPVNPARGRVSPSSEDIMLTYKLSIVSILDLNKESILACRRKSRNLFDVGSINSFGISI